MLHDFIMVTSRIMEPMRPPSMQVLGYTLHAVLEGVVRTGPPQGALDDSLPLILPMMEVRACPAELLGGSVQSSTSLPPPASCCRTTCTLLARTRNYAPTLLPHPAQLTCTA